MKSAYDPAVVWCCHVGVSWVETETGFEFEAAGLEMGAAGLGP